MTACTDSTIDFYDIIHEAAAVALCRTCPRVAECAEQGAQEPYGVWGATTPRERGFPGRRGRPRTASSRDLIAAHLTRQWIHQRQLVDWVDRSADTIDKTLRRMKADGVVEHSRGGYWRLA